MVALEEIILRLKSKNYLVQNKKQHHGINEW